MEVSGIKLTRQGNDAVVLAEFNGTWYEMIREPFDGCFDHIINDSGMITALGYREPPDEAFRSPEDERWHLGMLKTDKDLLKIQAGKTHGCHDCGEERFPRIVAGKLTCPDCGSENLVPFE